MSGSIRGGAFSIGLESTSLVAAMASLLIPSENTRQLSERERARVVQARLSQAPASLLLIDNLTGDEEWCSPEFRGGEVVVDGRVTKVTSFLPTAPCHIIVTTRDEQLSGIDCIDVRGLKEPEAVELLGNFRADALEREGEAGRSIQSAVEQIVRDLEGHAATVAAVGARMQLRPQDDWPEYADRVHRSGTDQLPDRLEKVRAITGYHRRTQTVLDDLYESLPLPERSAIEYAVLLPQDLVPAAWIEALIIGEGRTTGVQTEQRLGYDVAGESRIPADVVNHLRRLDLFRAIGDGGRLVSLHRLHALRCQERFGSNPKAREHRWGEVRNYVLARSRAMGVVRDQRIEEEKTRGPAADSSLRYELEPLAAMVPLMIAAGDPAAAAEVAIGIASPLKDIGRVEQAQTVMEAVLAEADSLEPILLATVWNDAAIIVAARGDRERARQLMEQAIDVGPKTLGPSHPTVATRHSNLATILYALGNIEGAREHIEKAIEIGESALEPDHPGLARSYSNLAMILKQQGKPALARDRVERAIAIDEAQLGSDHPTLGILHSNLASILLDLHDTDAAKAHIERALRIEERSFDLDHPLLATRYLILAQVLQKAGATKEARVAVQRAEAIAIQALGDDHPTTAEIRAFRDSYIEA